MQFDTFIRELRDTAKRTFPRVLNKNFISAARIGVVVNKRRGSELHSKRDLRDSPNRRCAREERKIPAGGCVVA